MKLFRMIAATLAIVSMVFTGCEKEQAPEKSEVKTSVDKQKAEGGETPPKLPPPQP